MVSQETMVTSTQCHVTNQDLDIHFGSTVSALILGSLLLTFQLLQL